VTDKHKVNPLGAFVEGYLRFYSYISLRALLFGVDPDHTRQYISAHQGAVFNRDTLVDFYAIGWPLFGCLLLWRISVSLQTHPLCALLICLIAIYRLNELIGGVLYVLVYRARYDFADARKLATSLLAYLEPILFFAILHGASSAAVLFRATSSTTDTGYMLGGRPWTWVTMLHYSVGCYTTVGWGDVVATVPRTMVLSDIETVTGILMLTLTISRFVAAAMDASMVNAVERLAGKEGAVRTAHAQNEAGTKQ
jgi:hypothetical protein